ncbi:hypothetical protein D022_3787A, partial [Vibrio parahaemolyticus 12310]|jgi:hypothetical protein
MACR